MPNNAIEILKAIAKSYQDLLDLKTPLGTGASGARNTLPDVFSIGITALATITPVLLLPGDNFPGIYPSKSQLGFTLFFILAAWFTGTYVAVAGMDWNRFKSLVPLNLNLALVWVFISTFIVFLTAYVGEYVPSEAVRQSEHSALVIAILISVHVLSAKSISPAARVTYLFALLISSVAFISVLFPAFTSPVHMLRLWFG